MFKKRPEADEVAATPSTYLRTRPPEGQSVSPPPRLFDGSDQSRVHRPHVAVSSSSPPTEMALSRLETEEPEAVIGQGVVINGSLSFSRYLRIEGVFEGELQAGAKLVVGRTGRVKSNLELQEAIIEGEVEGNIIAHRRVELRGEAKVVGDITAKFLSIDEGVSLKGTLRIGFDEEGLKERGVDTL